MCIDVFLFAICIFVCRDSVEFEFVKSNKLAFISYKIFLCAKKKKKGIIKALENNITKEQQRNSFISI